MKHWILEGHAIKETDLMTWAEWFEHADRRVALDKVGTVRVSTVFLGIDHNFGLGGPPLLFETMVFPHKGWTESAVDRYATWAEAEAGHAAMLKHMQEQP